MNTEKTIEEIAGADFSECRNYRYALWRIWDQSKPRVMFIGLNPSTANSDTDDQTIQNLRRILIKLGYGGFYMMNLFAWISSKPKELLTCENPIGENDSKLKEVAALCSEVIVCWGAFKQAGERIKQVLPNYPNAKCFGKNKNGTPMHPLALMYNGTVKNPQLQSYSQ